MNQIWLLLGLKPEGFKAGIKQASDATKSFEKDWKNLGKIFSAGGLIYLVTGFFRTIIEHANEASTSVDENTAAVRRFGESMAEAKDTVLDWGVQLVGVINRAGEGLGMLLKIAGRASNGGFWSSLLKGDYAGAMASIATATASVKDEEQKLAQTERDLAETQKTIAERGKKYVVDRKKAYDDELKALTEGYKIDRERADALEKLAAFDRKARLDKMTDEEKLLALEKERRELAAQLAVFEHQGKEGMQLTKEGAEELLGLKEQQASVEKEIAAITKDKAKAEALIGEQVASNIAEWEQFKGLIESTGRGNKELSDAELQRKISQMNRDLAMRGAGGLGTYQGAATESNYDVLGESLKGSLSQAEAELRLRQQTRANASIFGEAQAFQQSGLSEQRFKEILGTMTGADRADRTNRTLDDINRTVQDSNAQSKRLADLLAKGVTTVVSTG